MGFIEFILISALVVYLIWTVAKFLLKRYIARSQREFAERFGGAENGTFRQYTWGAGQRNGSREQQKEGDVKVVDTGSNPKKVNNKVGDYVEFEEIEIEYDEIEVEIEE